MLILFSINIAKLKMFDFKQICVVLFGTICSTVFTEYKES
jgi:hypothetical protein